MECLWRTGKFETTKGTKVHEVKPERICGGSLGFAAVRSESRQGADLVRWGHQIRHLARIFTVDNVESVELNSLRRVSTLNECRAFSHGAGIGEKKGNLPRS
jgi:hypothetical protein